MILRVEHAPGDRPGVTIVRIYGDIDLASAPRLRAELQDLDRRGHHRLVLELGYVDHIDSVGIGVLLGALRRARQAGGSATVASPSGHVARLFALLGIDAVFAGTPDQLAGTPDQLAGTPDQLAAPPGTAPAPISPCGGRP